MKKIILALLIIILAGFGFWYYKKNLVTTNPDTSHYRSTKYGISFNYPKILTVSDNGSDVVVHHDVPFVHHDYCDFKGEGTTTIPTLTDFNLKIHTNNKDIVSAMREESPYIPAENFANGQVVPSPGFIDSFNAGDIKGYKIFEGAEGCGHTIYYLKLSSSKTLVMTEDLITVFTGAIDDSQVTAAEAVPGVINKEKETSIFNSIVGSLKEN